MATDQLYGLGDKGQKVLGQTYKIDDKGNYLYYDGNRAGFYNGPQADQWRADLERQALDKNRDALSRGDLSTWSLYNRAAAPQFGPSGMPLTQQGADSLTTGKVWMPDANDPAAKFFTPEALKALYLQGGAGTDGGYGKVNVGSLDQYLGAGAKDYLMSQGVEGADDDKHKITFYDPTKPYWGADAFKEKSKLRGNAESLAKAVGTAVAMYTGGAALAGAAGSLGAAGAVEAGTAGATSAGAAGAAGTGTAAATTSSGILGSGISTGSAFADSIAAGALKGAGYGAVTGGGKAALTGGDILKGALQGAATGAVTGGVGAGLAPALSSIPSSGYGIVDQAVKQGVSGAVSGGVRAGLSGDNVGDAMLAGGLSGAAVGGSGTALKDFGVENPIVTKGVLGAVGGAVNSAVKGGDVTQGIVQGAMSGGASGLGQVVSDATDSKALGDVTSGVVKGYLGTQQQAAKRQQAYDKLTSAFDAWAARKGLKLTAQQRQQMLAVAAKKAGLA